MFIPRAMLVLALAGLTACAPGCARRAAPEPLVHAAPGAGAGAGAAYDDVIAPVVRGGTNGLEVLWFVCRDEGSALARTLAPYVYQPVELSPETADALRRNGLRIVRVPLADFSAIRASLRPVGPTERSWLGWSLHWSEAFRARSVAARSTVLIDGDPVILGASGSRFIARAWGSPTAEGERVRVEFATQLLDGAQPVAPYHPLAPTEAVDLSAYELRRGDVLDQLAFEAQLEPGYAYLLAPAPPDEDWVALVEGSPSRDDTREPPAPGFEFAEPQDDARAVASRFGPHAPAPLTIGQAILTSWNPFETSVEAAERRATLKAVVALVPRCDAPARLLPPAR